jgi:hypothetical protein
LSNRSKAKRDSSKEVAVPETMGKQENLEKIRDLLFGPQVKGFQSQLDRLEESLIREIHDVREEFRRRVDSIEQFLNGELDKLSGKISSEAEDRSAVVKKLNEDVREIQEVNDNNTSRLDNKIEQNAKETRQQLLEQTKQLTDDMLRKHEEALQALMKSSNQIRADYVDRSNLSRLFTELAVQLNTELAESLLSGLEEPGDD